MIKSTVLKHRWYYHYRLHIEKTERLCSENFTPLKEYLASVFSNCPHNLFISGPSSSKLRFSLPARKLRVTGHMISALAEQGLRKHTFTSNHLNVQVFLLENDSSTLGIEVPIWLNHEELEDYKKLFNSEESLTGHIDILQVHNNKIWVWDYKPNAEKEKYATTQIFFYSLMLSKRTNIPLDKFVCGYFDDKEAYFFQPSLELLKAIN